LFLPCSYQAVFRFVFPFVTFCVYEWNNFYVFFFTLDEQQMKFTSQKRGELIIGSFNHVRRLIFHNQQQQKTLASSCLGFCVRMLARIAFLEGKRFEGVEKRLARPNEISTKRERNSNHISLIFTHHKLLAWMSLPLTNITNIQMEYLMRTTKGASQMLCVFVLRP
jgi:hypothetical protein